MVVDRKHSMISFHYVTDYMHQINQLCVKCLLEWLHGDQGCVDVIPIESRLSVTDRTEFKNIRTTRTKQPNQYTWNLEGGGSACRPPPPHPPPNTMPPPPEHYNAKIFMLKRDPDYEAVVGSWNVASLEPLLTWLLSSLADVESTVQAEPQTTQPN